MGLGAIVVVGAGGNGFNSLSPESAEGVLAGPLECVEILGRSVVERTIERLVRADVEAITILLPRGAQTLAFSCEFPNVTGLVVDDIPAAIGQQLALYSQNSIEHSFVLAGSLYAEADLLDFFYFHREARQTATRASNQEGTLALWAVDCARAQETDLEALFTRTQETGTTYVIRDYVMQLSHPRDLRRLVTDALSKRSALRPNGRETRPGIWVDEGAEVHKRARIVAPAYIGRDSKVEEDTLVTRCSSIERDCCIDCGTVIEDSSILANTQIGIWLDVCHAITAGNQFISLSHDVVIRILDPNVMRAEGQVRVAEHGLIWNEQEEFGRPRVVADLKQGQSPLRQTRSLEPILSRSGD